MDKTIDVFLSDSYTSNQEVRVKCNFSLLFLIFLINFNKSKIINEYTVFGIGYYDVDSCIF